MIRLSLAPLLAIAIANPLAAAAQDADARGAPPEVDAAGAPVLLARYPLDGDARDAVGRADGRAVQTVPAPDRRGAPTGALAFDGNARVELGVRVEPARLTLAAWVAPARFGHELVVFSKRSGADAPAPYLELRVEPDGRPAFTLPGARPQAVRAGRPLPAGRFTHLAATFDGRRAALYVDGVLAGEAFLAPFQPARGPAFLGARPDPAGQRARPNTGFEGRIDDVRLYREAIDAGDAARLAEARPAPEPPAPPAPPPPSDREAGARLARLDRLLARFDAACAERDRALLARVEARAVEVLDDLQREAAAARGPGARERRVRLEHAAAELSALQGRTDPSSLSRKRAALVALSEHAWHALVGALDGNEGWSARGGAGRDDRGDRDERDERDERDGDGGRWP